jgi:site-specific DNA recombinase
MEGWIADLLDRIVEAKSESVIAAYEKRIEKLERKKLLLAEKAAMPLPNEGRLEECIELSL